MRRLLGAAIAGLVLAASATLVASPALATPSDADGDGYISFADGGDDCDDANSGIHPGAVDIPGDGVDQDCDGFDLIDADLDGYGSTLDCDDADPGIHPDAIDTPSDGVDQDCDGFDLVDIDADGHGTPASGGDDCDDLDPDVHPGAIEVAGDGLDQDCDGFDLVDGDGDGHGSALTGGDDCDDAAGNVYPGAQEVLDEGDVDEDCDGLADCADPTASPACDGDSDGYDSIDTGGADCDDADPEVNPGAAEVASDGRDQDCDGVDLIDGDGDGHGSAATGGDDCDDTNGSAFPGGQEVLDPADADEDCDGVTECADPSISPACDGDLDGYDSKAAGGTDCNDANATIHPGATEIIGNTVDENCDGKAPRWCWVPNVRLRTLAVAKSKLITARCRVGTITRKHSRLVGKGRVISQSIKAGTRRIEGTRVSLVVSVGP